MKKRRLSRTFALTVLVGVLSTPMICYSESSTRSNTKFVKTDKVLMSAEHKSLGIEKKDNKEGSEDSDSLPAPTKSLVVKKIVKNVVTKTHTPVVRKSKVVKKPKIVRSHKVHATAKPVKKKVIKKSKRVVKKESNSNGWKFSQNDLNILYRIVEAEETGGNINAKMSICFVVLNRIKSNQFPDTIKGVVFQRSQFSPISDGRYYSVKVTESTKNAVNKALYSKDFTNGAVYFCEPSLVGDMRWWNSLNCTYVNSSGQKFYK